MFLRVVNIDGGAIVMNSKVSELTSLNRYKLLILYNLLLRSYTRTSKIVYAAPPSHTVIKSMEPILDIDKILADYDSDGREIEDPMEQQDYESPFLSGKLPKRSKKTVPSSIAAYVSVK